MIPYWNLDPIIPFGNGKGVHAFGVLVACGILLGSWITVRRARERAVDELHLRSAISWLLVFGFIIAHLFAVVAYEPEKVLADPLVLVKIWEGLASTGGFIGAFIGLWIYCRREKVEFAPLADVISLGLLPGWLFGRIGCYTAHDHPGQLTDFVLGVAYPGGARHDLGFYEVLFTLALIGIFEVVRRRSLAPGRIATLIGLLYAPGRFALDFMRITNQDPSGLHGDVRYFGLTPAQYACLFLFALCVYLLLRKAPPAPAPVAATAKPHAKKR